MLKMPIVWFDIPKNNAGGLTARLSSDCKSVNGLTTTFIGVSIQNVVTLVTSLIIGFVFEWRTSLVTLGLIPVMILAGAIQMQQSTGFSS
jgi:ATP-binding cassette subfamily B (MDR/TAP) protein 1